MSLPPPPPPPPPPLRTLDRQGYLLRYETLSGRSGWKRRWAVICDNCLYLYRDPESKECLYALLLSSARVTQSHDTTGQYRSSIKLEESNQLAVYLSTDTPKEFDAWYRALSVASLNQQQMQLQRQRHQINSGWAGHAQRHSDLYGNNYTVVTSSDLNRYRHQSGGGGGGDGFDMRDHRRQLTVSQPNLAFALAVTGNGQQSDYQMPYAVSAAAAASSGTAVDSLLRADESEEAHYAVVRDPDTAGGWQQQQQQQLGRTIHVSNGFAPAMASDGPLWTNGGGRGGGGAGNSRMIETVREDPAMEDNQVLATAPLEEIRRRYPVSGLAKRMSIAASDLLGKPHDELLLLLIQLQREKAALERRHEHCVRLSGVHPAASATVERLRQEIREAEHQMELSEPLLSFIANIIAMGAMYQGDDLAFASEYRRHLLQPGQARPARPVIGQQRRRQEAEVARQCQPMDAPVAGVPADVDESGGDVEFRRTRRRLESELASLEAAYAEHRRRKSGLADFMADLGRRGTAAAAAATTAARRRPVGGGGVSGGAYLETDLDTGKCVDLAAKFPRRNGGVVGNGASTARSASSLRAAVSTPALNAVGFSCDEADDESGYFGASGTSRGAQRGGDDFGIVSSEANRRPRVEQALSVTSLNASGGPLALPYRQQQQQQQQPPPLPQRRFANGGGGGGQRSVSVQEQLNTVVLLDPRNVKDRVDDESAAAAERKARIRRVLAGYSLQQFTRQELGGLSLAEERRRRELAMAEREHVGTEASRLAVRGYLQ